MIHDLDILEQWRTYKEEESMVRRPASQREIRPYELPKINFEARCYNELITWRRREEVGSEEKWGSPVGRWEYTTFTPGAKEPYGNREVTLAPILAQMTKEELEELRYKRLRVDYPCHSQAVEQAVALTSDSVKKYRSDEARLAGLLQTYEARQKQPGRVTVKKYMADCMALASNEE